MLSLQYIVFLCVSDRLLPTTTLSPRRSPGGKPTSTPPLRLIRQCYHIRPTYCGTSLPNPAYCLRRFLSVPLELPQIPKFLTITRPSYHTLPISIWVTRRPKRHEPLSAHRIVAAITPVDDPRMASVSQKVLGPDVRVDPICLCWDSPPLRR